MLVAIASQPASNFFTKLKHELEAMGATMPKDTTLMDKVGETIVAIASHMAIHTSTAFAIAAKRQESAG
jgi:hypothetical protein